MVAKSFDQARDSLGNRRNVQGLADHARRGDDDVVCVHLQLLCQKLTHLFGNFNSVCVAGIGVSAIADDRLCLSVGKVVFGYDQRNILDGISFSIPKGSLVAVVGATGSGKTTIANLIARFYDVRSGSVTIDGVDVRDCEVKSLRRLIGIVSQEPLLFNTSIAENIAYGCPDATREDIIQAAREANAENFITDGRHADGYDTVVGEKGFRLSGGEKQRVAIARAILKNPPILILDEATSALDTVTERLVQNALNRVMSNRTVFAIAHRLSTIQNADLIIVLQDGKIVERGTHEELLQANGVYKKLHSTQFELNKAE